jgi:glucosamine--fructose-6-phosphate aminotransferase (isomerizing)
MIRDGCPAQGALYHPAHEDGSPLEKKHSVIDWNASMAEKAGYRHFMLRKIFEHPQAILNTVSGRIVPDTGVVDLPEIGLDPTTIKSIDRIALVACGTLLACRPHRQILDREMGGNPVEVDIASRFRYQAASGQ